MPAAGSLLAGRYRLEEVIGRGGMSTVYRARDETLGRTVAVKMLLPTLAEQDPTYSARFEREARAAAALSDSAVVTVYDTGLDDDSHYIVMEYVEGQSLEQILRAGRPLETSEALRIALRVADALAAAHAAGILHRDIKPANVMVTDAGAVKVLDFGIARRLDGTTITQAASVVGTAAYMAPEQALGQPGDARADVYSLGCLLYAMLTGAPPFGGEISAAVLHQQINAEPRPPSALRAGISPALDGLVLDMLAKSPDERPATAAEVRARIASLPEAREITVPPAAPGALTTATAPIIAAPTLPGGGRAPVRHRQPVLADHRRRAIVMAIVTALITLVAVALLSSGGSSGSPTTQSQPAARTAPPHTTATSPPTTSATTQATTTTTTPAAKPKPPKPKAPGPPAPGTGPPGHGGQPPGQAKKPGPGAGPG
jgi:eukaryotic-like serine/threonine-protein kinase